MVQSSARNRGWCLDQCFPISGSNFLIPCTLQSEIEELLRKVNALKLSRDECVEKIKQLDATIESAIAVHGPEKDTLNYELELVVKRKADIDARSVSGL
jgi:hypothetical protein